MKPFSTENIEDFFCNSFNLDDLATLIISQLSHKKAKGIIKYNVRVIGTPNLFYINYLSTAPFASLHNFFSLALSHQLNN